MRRVRTISREVLCFVMTPQRPHAGHLARGEDMVRALRRRREVSSRSPACLIWTGHQVTVWTWLKRTVVSSSANFVAPGESNFVGAAGYMLEHPRIPHYSPKSAVKMRRVRTISREDPRAFGGNPQRLHARQGSKSPEDTVRAAWRHAESGRNDLALELFARE